MSTRTRASNYSVGRYNYLTGDPYGLLEARGTTEIISEFAHFKGVSSCNHRKLISPANGPYGRLGSITHVMNDHPCEGDSVPIPGSLTNNINTIWNQQLAGEAQNNQFELIPFLADLDGTFAMFTKKFIREISYGSVTWGILPFIADCQAMINSLRDLFGRYGKYSHCTKISRRKPVFYETPFTGYSTGGTFAIYQFNGVVSTTGVQTFNPVNTSKVLGKAQLLLDELGVHPDLRTAWDIIPLSFVVDYFIPIGDLLGSLQPRGWGSTSYTFTGFQTFRGLYEVAYDYYGYHGGTNYVPAIWSIYQRNFRQSYSPTVPEVEFTAPSLKEVFNAVYLQGLLRKVESGFLHEKIYDKVYLRPRR